MSPWPGVSRLASSRHAPQLRMPVPATWIASDPARRGAAAVVGRRALFAWPCALPFLCAAARASHPRNTRPHTPSAIRRSIDLLLWLLRRGRRAPRRDQAVSLDLGLAGDA